MFQSDTAPILLIILGAFLLQQIIKIVIDRGVQRFLAHHKFNGGLDAKKRRQTLSAMFKTFAAVIIWLVAITLVLLQLNVNLAGIATGAGLVGIVVGFGAQSSVKDVLAGVFIIAENQYRIGDIVSLLVNGKDIWGEVEDITIRITRLRDLDGNTHIIPNGSIVVTTNLSFHFANANVDIDVAYDTDIDHAERVINDVGKNLAEDDEWKAHIFEPISFLRLEKFGDSSIRLKALGKVEPAKQWDVAGEFRRRLKKAFEEEGIEIPFNQIVIHQAKQKTPPKKSSKHSSK